MIGIHVCGHIFPIFVLLFSSILLVHQCHYEFFCCAFTVFELFKRVQHAVCSVDKSLLPTFYPVTNRSYAGRSLSLTIASQLYIRTEDVAFFSSFLLRDSSSINVIIAFFIDFASSPDNNPFSRWVINLLFPNVLVAITGSPQAKASTVFKGGCMSKSGVMGT